MIGIVTGLRREARLVARPGLDVMCLGPGPAAAEQAAATLIASGASLLASVGYAGGLDPALRPGDLVIADRVVSAHGAEWPLDPTALAARLPQAYVATIVGLDAPAAAVAAKADLASLGAAVDTESHAVAAVAARAGIACLSVRVIVDAADIALPDAALAATTSDGSLRIWPLIRGLAVRPAEVREVLALTRAAGSADRMLALAAGALAAL